MPIYQYKCRNCNNSWEDVRTVEKRHESICVCGQLADIVISPTAKPVILDYFDMGLGAMITGPKHKRSIMKQKGIEEAE